MRRAILAALILVAAPAASFAQSGPYITTVIDLEVKLRAGPSDSFPETATLAKGAQLLVDHEEANGWLAVQEVPGTGHSMSWVQMQFVDFQTSKPTPQLVMTTDPTTLRVGQMGLAQPLEVGRTKLPAGTALRVIGAKVEFMGRSWYPVEPPAGDFRYVPKHAVRFEKTVSNAFVVREATPPPAEPSVSPASAFGPASGAGSSTLPAIAVGKSGTVNHPLWTQAEAAERDGKYDEAEKLYFKLASVMNQPGGDRDIANLCYTRIHTLREKKRGSAGSSTSSGSRLPAAEPSRSANGTLPPAAPGDERPRWTGPGKLALSAIALDGRKTYILESSAGSPGVYVVPGPGVNLDRFVGKRVDISGITHTRAGLSKPYVVATAVEMPQ